MTDRTESWVAVQVQHCLWRVVTAFRRRSTWPMTYCWSSPSQLAAVTTSINSTQTLNRDLAHYILVELTQSRNKRPASCYQRALVRYICISVKVTTLATVAPCCRLDDTTATALSRVCCCCNWSIIMLFRCHW